MALPYIKTNQIFSFGACIVNEKSEFIIFLFITFRYYFGIFLLLFLLLFRWILNYFLWIEPFQNIGLFWNFLDILFGVLKYDIIKKSHFRTIFTLKFGLPIYDWNIMKEFFLIFSYLLLLKFGLIFLLDPFR